MSRIADPAQAASALEAYFLRRVLGEVHPGEAGLLGSGFAGGMFKEMFDEAIADAMAKAGGVGIADMVAKQLGPTAAKATTSTAVEPGAKTGTAGAAHGASAAPAAAHGASAAPAAAPVRPDSLQHRMGLDASGRGHRVSALRPDTEPEARPVGGAPPVVPDSPAPVRPDSPQTSVRPDSPQTSVRPDSPQTSVRPDSPHASVRRDRLEAVDPSARLAAPDGLRPPRSASALGPYAAATTAPRPLTTLPLEHLIGTSGFGRRTDPIEGDTRKHNGLDLAAPEGAPVRAAGSGIVKFAGDAGTYGNLVIVDHGGGVETRYAHLARIGVKAGQTLEAGAQLGGVGQTGRSTGPHLHFEVRRDGQPCDPTSEFFSPSSLASAGRPTDWR